MRRPPAALAAALAVAGAGLLPGCGYHLAGKGSNLPAHVKTIAVPELRNQTTRSELGQRVTEAVTEELVRRGRYRVTSESAGADAVLTGTILSWSSRPVLLSESDSDAQRVAVTLRASVTFEDKVQSRMLWKQDDYTFTAQYEVIGDPNEYFDTELSAVEEVAEDFARAVISAIMQGF